MSFHLVLAEQVDNLGKRSKINRLVDSHGSVLDWAVLRKLAAIEVVPKKHRA